MMPMSLWREDLDGVGCVCLGLQVMQAIREGLPRLNLDRMLPSPLHFGGNMHLFGTLMAAHMAPEVVI